MSHVLEAIILAAMVAYVTYRLSLSVRVIQARRAGDHEREGQLRARAFALLVGCGFGTVVLFLVLAFVNN